MKLDVRIVECIQSHYSNKVIAGSMKGCKAEDKRLMDTYNEVRAERVSKNLRTLTVNVEADIMLVMAALDKLGYQDKYN